MKQINLGELISFLDHVYLDCTQRECETSKDMVVNCRKMFESRISAGVKEKLPSTGRRDANISTWPFSMDDHAKKCEERYYELTNKATQQLYKVASPCLDDHQFKEVELGFVGELSKVCSQIGSRILKCWSLPWALRFEYWSVCCILPSSKQRIPKRKCRETCCVTDHQEKHQHPNQDQNSAQRSWVIQCRL